VTMEHITMMSIWFIFTVIIKEKSS